MKFNKLNIHGSRGFPLRNTLFSPGSGKKGLALLFPGAGYTCDMPALYYSRSILLSQKYDVLSLEYSFQNQGEMFDPDRIQEVLEDGEKVMDSIEKLGYSEFILVGKSLGTRVLTHLLSQRKLLDRAKAVYLTPVFSRVFNDATAGVKQEVFMVIGTKDPFYSPELIQDLKSQKDFQLLVLEGTDHGLEIPGDCIGSILRMKTLCLEMVKFFNK
ncbi:alpha/beta hydrolase [Candidatus Contubernalis alkaliaceticus]|uniref:alpha/beta hydrolase n=1 Tax=Candidatus Contubernalis alkaliaceticus TaxID=338645 RepID=UPI001F4C018B|nr:alpha/beta family hydrolase [Candidatus Contubernalis alkalaceticus]UNC91916.1 hypothetical protein HUE98_07285 [Candidatus Contubernalis alkalaceticus]